MPLTLVRQDITKMEVDVIVNSAHPAPAVGGGVDEAIHRAAGPKLLEARKTIGALQAGQVVMTPAFLLPSQWVIHTVGPVWHGGYLNEPGILFNCYWNSLNLAQQNRCQSIAFPLISSGAFHFPKGLAFEIAIKAIREFLVENDLEVYLVLFDQESFEVSEKKVEKVVQFIDENYVAARRSRSRFMTKEVVMESIPRLSESDIEKELKTGKNFVETLFQYIDRKGLDEVTVYKNANIDRKLFSKIRSNWDYQPKKATALALAIGLKLNLNETKDFISRAGYALSPSSKFDLIIEYHILHEIYDIYEINLALFNLADHQTLGG